MHRTCYALPKVKGKSRTNLTKEQENQLLVNVFTELEELRKKRFPNVTEWKCKGVTRKYCFETPLEHGEHKFLKIKYPATMPCLPQNLSGNTFDTVFSTNQSMLELFILKRKIKGPCWLSLTNVKKVSSEHRSTWCRQELIVDNPKDVTCRADDLNKSPPPLISVTLHAQMLRNAHNTNEIAMISFLV